VTPEEIRAFGAKALFDKYGISGLKLLAYSRQVHAALSKHLDEIKPCPGIKELLSKLDCPLAIVTSNSTENAERFLKANGITCFSFVLGGVRMFGKKDKMKEAAKRVNADDVFCIGDEITDIEAAKSLGFKAVAVTWGFNSKELLEKAKPDYILEKPEELLKL
jgi:phosphoglycolate phosphatase